MSQKLPVNGFEWIKNISQLSEDLAKNYNEEKDEGYFPEVDVQYLEKLHEFCNDLSFFSEGMKFERVEKVAPDLHDKA